MKKGLYAIAICFLLICVIFGVCLAAGNLPWAKNKAPISNITAIAPEKNSGCTTKTGTKGTFGTYTSLNGYVLVEGEVANAASGAAVPVTWELDGVAMGTGSSFRATNTGANTYKRMIQRLYSSGTSNSYKSCVRRQ